MHPYYREIIDKLNILADDLDQLFIEQNNHELANKVIQYALYLQQLIAKANIATGDDDKQNITPKQPDEFIPKRLSVIVKYYVNQAKKILIRNNQTQAILNRQLYYDFENNIIAKNPIGIFESDELIKNELILFSQDLVKDAQYNFTIRTDNKGKLQTTNIVEEGVLPDSNKESNDLTKSISQLYQSAIQLKKKIESKDKKKPDSDFLGKISLLQSEQHDEETLNRELEELIQAEKISEHSIPPLERKKKKSRIIPETKIEINDNNGSITVFVTKGSTTATFSIDYLPEENNYQVRDFEVVDDKEKTINIKMSETLYYSEVNLLDEINKQLANTKNIELSENNLETIYDSLDRLKLANKINLSSSIIESPKLSSGKQKQINKNSQYHKFVVVNTMVGLTDHFYRIHYDFNDNKYELFEYNVNGERTSLIRSNHIDNIIARMEFDEDSHYEEQISKVSTDLASLSGDQNCTLLEAQYYEPKHVVEEDAAYLSLGKRLTFKIGDGDDQFLSFDIRYYDHQQSDQHEKTYGIQNVIYTVDNEDRAIGDSKSNDWIQYFSSEEATHGISNYINTVLLHIGVRQDEIRALKENIEVELDLQPPKEVKCKVLEDGLTLEFDDNNQSRVHIEQNGDFINVYYDDLKDPKTYSLLQNNISYDKIKNKAIEDIIEHYAENENISLISHHSTLSEAFKQAQLTYLQNLEVAQSDESENRKLNKPQKKREVLSISVGYEDSLLNKKLDIINSEYLIVPNYSVDNIIPNNNSMLLRHVNLSIKRGSNNSNEHYQIKFNPDSADPKYIVKDQKESNESLEFDTIDAVIAYFKLENSEDKSIEKLRADLNDLNPKNCLKLDEKAQSSHFENNLIRLNKSVTYLVGDVDYITFNLCVESPNIITLTSILYNDKNLSGEVAHNGKNVIYKGKYPDGTQELHKKIKTILVHAGTTTDQIELPELDFQLHSASLEGVNFDTTVTNHFNLEKNLQLTFKGNDKTYTFNIDLSESNDKIFTNIQKYLVLENIEINSIKNQIFEQLNQCRNFKKPVLSKKVNTTTNVQKGQFAHNYKLGDKIFNVKHDQNNKGNIIIDYNGQKFYLNNIDWNNTHRINDKIRELVAYASQNRIDLTESVGTIQKAIQSMVNSLSYKLNSHENIPSYTVSGEKNKPYNPHLHQSITFSFVNPNNDSDSCNIEVRCFENKLVVFTPNGHFKIFKFEDEEILASYTYLVDELAENYDISILDFKDQYFNIIGKFNLKIPRLTQGKLEKDQDDPYFFKKVIDVNGSDFTITHNLKNSQIYIQYGDYKPSLPINDALDRENVLAQLKELLIPAAKNGYDMTSTIQTLSDEISQLARIFNYKRGDIQVTNPFITEELTLSQTATFNIDRHDKQNIKISIKKINDKFKIKINDVSIGLYQNKETAIKELELHLVNNYQVSVINDIANIDKYFTKLTPVKIIGDPESEYKFGELGNNKNGYFHIKTIDINKHKLKLTYGINSNYENVKISFLGKHFNISLQDLTENEKVNEVVKNLLNAGLDYKLDLTPLKNELTSEIKSFSLDPVNNISEQQLSKFDHEHNTLHTYITLQSNDDSKNVEKQASLELRYKPDDDKKYSVFIRECNVTSNKSGLNFENMEDAVKLAQDAAKVFGLEVQKQQIEFYYAQLVSLTNNVISSSSLSEPELDEQSLKISQKCDIKIKNNNNNDEIDVSLIKSDGKYNVHVGSDNIGYFDSSEDAFKHLHDYLLENKNLSIAGHKPSYNKLITEFKDLVPGQIIKKPESTYNYDHAKVGYTHKRKVNINNNELLFEYGVEQNYTEIKINFLGQYRYFSITDLSNNNGINNIVAEIIGIGLEEADLDLTGIKDNLRDEILKFRLSQTNNIRLVTKPSNSLQNLYCNVLFKNNISNQSAPLQLIYNTEAQTYAVIVYDDNLVLGDNNSAGMNFSTRDEAIAFAKNAAKVYGINLTDGDIQPFFERLEPQKINNLNYIASPAYQDNYVTPQRYDDKQLGTSALSRSQPLNIAKLKQPPAPLRNQGVNYNRGVDFQLPTSTLQDIDKVTCQFNEKGDDLYILLQANHTDNAVTDLANIKFSYNFYDQPPGSKTNWHAKLYLDDNMIKDISIADGSESTFLAPLGTEIAVAINHYLTTQLGICLDDDAKANISLRFRRLGMEALFDISKFQALHNNIEGLLTEFEIEHSVYNISSQLENIRERVKDKASVTQADKSHYDYIIKLAEAQSADYQTILNKIDAFKINIDKILEDTKYLANYFNVLTYKTIRNDLINLHDKLVDRYNYIKAVGDQFNNDITQTKADLNAIAGPINTAVSYQLQPNTTKIVRVTHQNFTAAVQASHRSPDSIYTVNINADGTADYKLKYVNDGTQMRHRNIALVTAALENKPPHYDPATKKWKNVLTLNGGNFSDIKTALSAIKSHFTKAEVTRIPSINYNGNEYYLHSNGTFSTNNADTVEISTVNLAGYLKSICQNEADLQTFLNKLSRNPGEYTDLNGLDPNKDDSFIQIAKRYCELNNKLMYEQCVKLDPERVSIPINYTNPPASLVTNPVVPVIGPSGDEYKLMTSFKDQFRNHYAPHNQQKRDDFVTDLGLDLNKFTGKRYHNEKEFLKDVAQHYCELYISKYFTSLKQNVTYNATYVGQVDVQQYGTPNVYATSDQYRKDNPAVARKSDERQYYEQVKQDSANILGAHHKRADRRMMQPKHGLSKDRVDRKNQQINDADAKAQQVNKHLGGRFKTN